MTYRTMLLQLGDSPYNEAWLRTALELATRFDAGLIAAHIIPPPFVMVGLGEGAAYVGPGIITLQREAAQAVRNRVRASFDAVASGESRLTWHEEEGDPGECAQRLARSADLTITGQVHVSGLDALAPQVVEQLVLQAGGPVLMLPDPTSGGKRPIGARVLVAWNGRREAVRAVKDALPLLDKAEVVTVLSVGAEGGSPDPALALLERHGVKASATRMGEAKDVGQTLVESAHRHGCDLLVMGAYGHSRLRELVLGGATKHILRNADLPVLLSS